MKRMVFLVGVMACVGLSGCATEDYVRSQVNPLAERVSKLEAAAKASSMTDADQAAAIKQANDKAQQALDMANRTAGEVKSAAQDVQKAEAAANRAEAAAKDAAKSAEDAKQMARKSEKIFNLEQKK